MTKARLPFLEDVDHARVDEVIWGHRLREDQTAWLLVLEMLNVAQACLDSDVNDPLADMGRIDAPNARPRLRMRFRNLLFRLNQKAAELAEAVQLRSISSDKAWDIWLDHTKEYYEGPGIADYSVLRSRFDDFIQFERGIDLVRSTAISGQGGGKGIYNRFIFPIAPEALYWETGLKSDGGTKRADPTANTFTRAGTLLHIMLSRSANAPVLRECLKCFLERDSQARRLVRHLQIDEPDDSRTPPKTYLPYSSHTRFDRLGEDFFRILTLKAPDNDKLQWLVPLSALHLSLYHAEVALNLVKSDELTLPMICEIVAPRKTVVRQLSIESLTENADLARRAVDSYLNSSFNLKDWTAIVDDKEATPVELVAKARDFIHKTLKAPKRIYDDHVLSSGVDGLKDEVIRFFKDRHAREFSRVHVTYGREAGLISKRATNRYRYAPTDQLLQSLVLANVAHETSLEDFLDTLFLRYGIIVGPRQQNLLDQAGYAELGKIISGQSFRHNQSRLEARLKSMGMLRRLSDSQAYVINPLQPRESK